MSLVVQKFGGSSVADAAAMKRVAERICLSAKAGHQVVVVVSALGDTTDELLDLAGEISPNPPPRELDMLITAGEIGRAPWRGRGRESPWSRGQRADCVACAAQGAVSG